MDEGARGRPSVPPAPTLGVASWTVGSGHLRTNGRQDPLGSWATLSGWMRPLPVGGGGSPAETHPVRRRKQDNVPPRTGLTLSGDLHSGTVGAAPITPASPAPRRWGWWGHFPPPCPTPGQLRNPLLVPLTRRHRQVYTYFGTTSTGHHNALTPNPRQAHFIGSRTTSSGPANAQRHRIARGRSLRVPLSTSSEVEI